MRIGSAHKTAGHVLNMLQAYEADPRPKVYITIAGRSNALSGFTDGIVSTPVIACPPYSEKFGGADIYSSIVMPSGIAPALVLEPVNAALLAAKIFAVSDADVRKAVKAYQQANQETITADDAEIHQVDQVKYPICVNGCRQGKWKHDTELGRITKRRMRRAWVFLLPKKMWPAWPILACLPCSIADRKPPVLAVSDGQTLRLHKDIGLVSQVFDPLTLSTIQGDFAIGHTRYSTSWITICP